MIVYITMHNNPKSKSKCEKCNVSIPKNQPLLMCSLCGEIKHFKCNNLTKNDAAEIIKNGQDWTCQDCITSIFPVNLVTRKRGESHILEA